MRFFEWVCFFLEKLELKHQPDSGYFFFDEDTGKIHSI